MEREATSTKPPGQTVEDFRRDWLAGGTPQIAPLLKCVAADRQGELLGELLRIELGELSKRGVQRSVWDYYPMFTGFRPIIDKVFEARRLAQREEVKVDETEDPILVETSSPPPSTNPLREPQRNDDFQRRYQLRERLGGGSFGDVYRAIDVDLQREVAVKLLRAKNNDLQITMREARLAASIQHPAIVKIFDLVRRSDGSGCIVMEYVAGGTFARWLTDRDRSLESLVLALANVAEALQVAHARGLVHRDIKPDNILVDTVGMPRLVDFGLAVYEAEQSGLNGEFAGTLAYMAPEQIRGEAHLLDGRCDIWALGVILYEVLTEKKPFAVRHRRELCDEILNRAPRPPRMIDHALPESLERICLKCLTKDVTGRYTNAQDLARDLRRSVTTPPAGRPDNLTGTQLDGSAGLLRDTWEMLDPDLQDAFSLAFNKKRRTGSNRISTRDLFQALLRIQNDELLDLIRSLPPGAMPEPMDERLAPDDSVLREEPLLSDCVSDSLRAFQSAAPMPRKLSPTDLFVDIGKHGHGPSVRQLREHGVTANDLEARVDQLRLAIVRRTDHTE